MAIEPHGWRRFQDWLCEVHPRAAGQIALVQALLQLGNECNLGDVEERLWPLGPAAPCEELFRRQDRMRRLLSDLRRHLAEYNRLCGNGAEFLACRTINPHGARPLLKLISGDERSRQDRRQIAADLGEIHLLPNRVQDTLLLLHLAQPGVSPQEQERLGRLLVEDVPGREFEASDSPEYWGEEAIRIGCAHHVEIQARRSLSLASDPLQHWKLVAVWAEACQALGLTGCLRDWAESTYRDAVQAPELRDEPSVLYRLRRVWLNAAAWAADSHKKVAPLLEEFIGRAQSAERHNECFELRSILLKSQIYESVRFDRPALLRTVLRHLNEMLTDKNRHLSDLTVHNRRCLHWMARCHAHGEAGGLFEESIDLRRWLLNRGHLLQAARVQGYQANLLGKSGDWEGARLTATENVVLHIRYVARAHLLFPLRDLHNNLARDPRCNPQAVQALDLLRGQLAGIVQNGGFRPPRYEARDFEKNLGPLTGVLPHVLNADWQRLLIDVPTELVSRAGNSIA